jgi:hypothetical protein
MAASDVGTRSETGEQFRDGWPPIAGTIHSLAEVIQARELCPNLYPPLHGKEAKSYDWVFGRKRQIMPMFIAQTHTIYISENARR